MLAFASRASRGSPLADGLRARQDLHFFFSTLKHFPANQDDKNTNKHSTRTDPVSCSRGVPQGSVLGPTLFSIYTRKVPSILQECGVQVQLFADDILFYKSGQEPTLISESLSHALQILWEWLQSKGLVLNPDKTQLLFLRNKHQTVPSNVSVKVNNVELQRVSSAVYLGLCIDEHLSFKEQVDRLETKISRKIGAVSRAFGKMTLDCRRMYYLSLIQPDLEYASNAYVRCLSHGDLQRLVKLSKRAIRAVFNLPFWHHTQPLFDKLNLARIDKRFDLKLYCHTYRCLNELASPLLCSVFTRIAIMKVILELEALPISCFVYLRYQRLMV